MVNIYLLNLSNQKSLSHMELLLQEFLHFNNLSVSYQIVDFFIDSQTTDQKGVSSFNPG